MDTKAGANARRLLVVVLFGAISLTSCTRSSQSGETAGEPIHESCAELVPKLDQIIATDKLTDLQKVDSINAYSRRRFDWRLKFVGASNTLGLVAKFQCGDLQEIPPTSKDFTEQYYARLNLLKKTTIHIAYPDSMKAQLASYSIGQVIELKGSFDKYNPYASIDMDGFHLRGGLNE
jgi:hypothetical protein